MLAARLRGAHLPRGRELRATALFGVLVLGIGNGCLTYAETWIPSGLAALFITLSPFWLVGIEAMLPGGERLHAPTIIGLMVGLCGTALLLGPGAGSLDLGPNVWKGFGVLQLGAIGWNVGSIAQRRYPSRAHPVVAGGVQQLATGVTFLILAALVPEPSIRWGARGVAAILYLVVFGSIVGYSAYIYAMDRLPVAVVALYNYVNPVVAVGLGYWFYGEPFGWWQTAAVAFIFVGVAIVKQFGGKLRYQKS